MPGPNLPDFSRGLSPAGSRPDRFHAPFLRHPATRWLVVAGWVAVIFVFSSQSGSSSGALSQTITDFAERALAWLPGGANIETLHVVVRKCSHLLEYLVLGVAVGWAWSAWPGNRLARLQFLGPFLVVVALAAFDEAHQFFVPGRAAAVTDVLIDSVGGALGVALVTLMLRRRGGRTARNP